jgi:hypothetical protein
MILTARLHIQGHATEKEGIPLSSCDFAFTQEVDQMGMPVSTMQIGIINMSFSSIDDTDLAWWGMGSETKNGKLVFTGLESSKAFKTIDFQDAFCIKYHEFFVRDAEMRIDLTISARVLELSNVSHADFWPGFDA